MIHTRSEKMLQSAHRMISYMIEIQVDFVEYDLKDIDKLARENQIGRGSHHIPLSTTHGAKRLPNPNL